MGTLFGSAALELAIGLSLFFLTISLICSALREMIEALFKTRSADLERALRELLGDPHGTGTLATLMAHPLIAGLFRGAYHASGAGRGGNFPAYIPAGQFATAIIDLAARGPSEAAPYAPAPVWQGPIDIDRLRGLTPSIEDGVLRRALQTATDGAQTLDEAKRRLEAWFNGSMDRASGWYKRRTQWILLAIGFAAALILNLDAITVTRHLFDDPALRTAAVHRAALLASDKTGAEPPTIAALRGELSSVGFPVGWAWQDGRPWPGAQERLCAMPGCDPSQQWLLAADRVHTIRIGDLLLMPIGWLITALAVTMGAPFWFDLLGKIMIVRSTVKPAQKSPEAQSPETRAPRPLAAAEDPDVETDGPRAVAAAVPVPAQPPTPFVINRWRIGLDPEEGLA